MKLERTIATIKVIYYDNERERGCDDEHDDDQE